MINKHTGRWMWHGSASVVSWSWNTLVNPTGFSLVNAAVVCAVLESISGLEPSSVITEPRYLKLVTVLSFCPFTLISVLMPLVLFVISLVFSALLNLTSLVWTTLRADCILACSTSCLWSRPRYKQTVCRPAQPHVSGLDHATSRLYTDLLNLTSLVWTTLQADCILACSTSRLWSGPGRHQTIMATKL